MKKLTLYTKSREEFLQVSRDLAKLIHGIERKKPWVVDLNGDVASGKSLLALAFDSIYRPDVYENEFIPPGASSDLELNPNSDKPVIYTNFVHQLRTNKETYDKLLAEYVAKNRSAKILFATNIERISLRESYNYNASGINSDVLDIGIQVKLTTAKEKDQAGLKREFQEIIEAKEWEGVGDSKNPDCIVRQKLLAAIAHQKFWRTTHIFIEDDSPLAPYLQQLKPVAL